MKFKLPNDLWVEPGGRPIDSAAISEPLIDSSMNLLSLELIRGSLEYC
jgi:hypothetical protein